MPFQRTAVFGSISFAVNSHKGGSRSKKLLGAKGIATRSKDATILAAPPQQCHSMWPLGGFATGADSGRVAKGIALNGEVLADTTNSCWLESVFVLYARGVDIVR